MNFAHDKHKYDDIINLPHHVSKTRPRMSNIDRAAQFAPFAALVGYDAAVKETARLTDERVELDENSKTILNEKLQMILELDGPIPEAMITYFQKDKKKDGGAYITITGRVKKVDIYEQVIILDDGTKISLPDIFEIESDCFRNTYFG